MKKKAIIIFISTFMVCLTSLADSKIEQDIDSIINETKLKNKEKEKFNDFFSYDPHNYKEAGVSPTLYIKYLKTSDYNKQLFTDYYKHLIYISKNYNKRELLINKSKDVYQNVVCLKTGIGEPALEHLQYLATLTFDNPEDIENYRIGSDIVNDENKKYANINQKTFTNKCGEQ